MNKTMAGVTLATIILVSGAQAQDGREGPIAIDKCQTISQPGSYKLVDNLTFNNPSGRDCLSITANFVTIDLSGFTITSISPGGQFGPFPVAIEAEDTVGIITVRNGSISGNFVGGVVLGGNGSTVEGLRVSLLSTPMVGGVGISATGIVRGNTAVGISGGPGSGVAISGAGLITGNYVSGNRHGIEAGQGSTVIGNTATNSAVTGIEVGCPSNVIDNTATGTGFPGGNLVLNGTGCNNTNNVAP